MKKVFLLLFAALAIAFGLFLFSPPDPARPVQQNAAAVSADEPDAELTYSDEPVDWLAAYQPVIDSYLLYLDGAEVEYGDETERGDYFLSMGDAGISYLSRYGGTLGYALMDINGDNVPELLVGGEGTEYYDGCIFDLFTLQNGELRRVLASSERVLYRLRSDGLLYYEGSGGASFMIWLVYGLNGSSLELIDGAVQNGDLLFQVQEERADLSQMGENDIPLTGNALLRLTEAWESMVTSFPITPFKETET